MALSCARMRLASACNHTLAVPNLRKRDGDAVDDDDDVDDDKEGEEDVEGDEDMDGATELVSATAATFASSACADAREASEMESSDGRLSCGDERASVSAAGKAGPPLLLLLIKVTTPAEETTAMDDDEEEECTGEGPFAPLMENTALVLGRLEGADARVLESMDDVNGFGANHCDGSTNEEKNELTADADCDGGGFAVPAGADTAFEAAESGNAREEDERLEAKVKGLVRVDAGDADLVDDAAGSGISGCAAR